MTQQSRKSSTSRPKLVVENLDPTAEQSEQQPVTETTTPQPELFADAVQETSQIVDDEAVLDEYERLAADALLDDDDGDEPGAKDEIAAPIIEKNLPRFANFMSNPVTFNLWGVSDRQGMDELLYVTTKSFAPNFEDDVDLRRVRFFETVTTDGVGRLVWCFVPEKGTRKPNSWMTSKLAALEHSQKQWTTMRSRKKLQQYTYRPSNKDYGVPKFSGRTPAQWIAELHKAGMLVTDKNHRYYKKATDTTEE
jgi:hypothetical protein